MSHPAPFFFRLAAVLAFSALLAGCSESVTPVNAQSACALDVLEGATGTPPTASAGAELVATGWAADPQGKRVPKQLFVQLLNASGAVVASAERKEIIRRPDVVKHFNVPEIETSGYRAVIATKGLPVGTYEFAVESRFDSGAITCRLGRSVAIQ